MKKNKILILGSTGMLGSALMKHFLNDTENYDVFGTFRKKEENIFGDKATFFHALSINLDKTILLHLIENYDYIINAIGIIKPFINENIKDSIIVNSIFPRELSYMCGKIGVKLIHITTDCVYSGLKGRYDESDPHDATDLYGKTKSLGEPEDCMVLRTSIIGEEIHKFASLISWIKTQKGKDVGGFTNHYWNGITTKEYAKIIDKIIRLDLYEENLFHVFSNVVSKHEMLYSFNKKWDLDLNIMPTETEIGIDRTLNTKKHLCSVLDIASFDKMIEEL